MAIFTAREASDGAVFDFGGLLPVARIVTATTTASESSHPKMKAAPFLVPFFDARTRTKAVSGIGSKVIANPMRIRLRTIGRSDEKAISDIGIDRLITLGGVDGLKLQREGVRSPALRPPAGQ